MKKLFTTLTLGLLLISPIISSVRASNSETDHEDFVLVSQTIESANRIYIAIDKALTILEQHDNLTAALEEIDDAAKPASKLDGAKIEAEPILANISDFLSRSTTTVKAAVEKLRAVRAALDTNNIAM